jgi:uncharacterized cupin superfamily protein
VSSRYVVDEESVPSKVIEAGEHFAVTVRRLGRSAGSEKLGCSLCEVEPGKTAWPFHAHLANEEAIYVLSGRATLRLADEQVPLQAGDYVALPARKDLPHQVTNTGQETFRYLSISTMVDGDIAYYPDSGKVGTALGNFKIGDAVDYWDGEPVGDQEAEDDDPREEETERQIDDEIDALKKKLNLE